MINRRQFAKRATSALAALQSRSLWGVASSLSPSSDGHVGEFHLRDYLGIYDFPEELLSYALSFPADSIKKENLRLFLKGSRNPLVIQFTDVKEANGFLRSATLYFRTNLKKGEDKTFELMQRSETPSPDSSLIVVQDAGQGRVSIEAGPLQILVPANLEHTLNVPVSQAPAPLFAIAREPGKWVGAGSLNGPNDLIVQKIDARVVESGPLFLKYAVTYSFSENRSYTMEFRLQRNESHVEIDEYATSLGPDNQLDFQFSYKQGVDPNGRLLMANGGYSTGGSQQGASGPYDGQANPKGMLPIKLGIYTPNSINLPRAIAFWNDDGQNAILFALRRLPDWKTSQRALWSSSNLPDNLEFYAGPNGGDTFVRAAIVGQERHWAIGLIPRNAMIVRGIDKGKIGFKPLPPEKVWAVDSSMKGLVPYGAGPEVRLLQKLNDFSLNWYKDCIFEFTEDNRTASFKLPYNYVTPTTMTADDFIRQYARNYAFLAQVGWDYSAEMAGIYWGKDIIPEAVNYAYNGAKWTAADRLQLRSWIVFAAYLMELDTGMPQTSMLGGHPNFAAQWKQCLGVVPALFPLHPHAPHWRDTYLRFWDEYLDKYVRKADLETGTKPGRFTENICCYNYASMEGLYGAVAGMKVFDNTQILDRQTFRDWARWDMESRLPFRVNGARIAPPEGAHATTENLSPGGNWYNIACALARLLNDTDPVLAQQWLWTITAGREGKKPDNVQSTVFNDYGPVLRYDFDGPEEAYLHMQQLHGIGYRWGPASNGDIYFVAKGKVWSWNTPEVNGDGFDITKLSVLQDGKISLGDSLTSGVLYNFDFAQYYRADAWREKGVSAYKSRAVMMVRGDYVAIRDEVAMDQKTSFNWVNESSGLMWHVFSDTEFRTPLKSYITDFRFPLTFGETELTQSGVTTPTFSVRATGKFLVPATGKYLFRTMWNNPKQDVPAGDTVRMYLDDHKIFDGKGPGSTEIDLEARPYQIRFEYIHASSVPPSMMLSWKHPEFDKPTSAEVEKAFFLTEDQMPFIQEVQGGPGDQLHIVAPERVNVVPVTSGAAQIDANEFVLFGDVNIQETGKNLSFSGKAGYAKKGALALFNGSHIEMNGLGLSMDGGEFGASVRLVSSDSLEGHIAGKSGGNLRIHLPSWFPTQGLKGQFDGHDVPVTLEGSSILMPVSIQQRDGVKRYRITA